MPDQQTAELVQQISNDFEIESFQLTLASREFSFWRLSDPESVFDEQVIETPHDQLEWQPYWAQVWDAAIGMCQELIDRDLNEQSVLDLGCGLGITGAIAAAAGANVVLVDNAPPALDFARLNCLPWQSQTSVSRLDWKNDRLDQQFDLILGADIVYDPSDLQFLNSFWQSHLKPEGRVLLSEPSRAMTTNLMKKLKEFSWDWKEFSQVLDSNQKVIKLFELYCGK